MRIMMALCEGSLKSQACPRSSGKAAAGRRVAPVFPTGLYPVLLGLLFMHLSAAVADYVNFEVSHVDPIALTPS
ncbi:MAG: hypothetical protein GWN87_13060, partial [Desulfuromonadales bacterium]|nr:hypothetical protein [Desulfuromonadales bacterium]